MKKLFTLDKLTSGFFYFAILLFLIGFNFTDTPPPFGWYQQFMPNLSSSPVSDICFVDSLIGYAVTNYQAANDTDYILKTTNGGDNWNIIRVDAQQFAGFNQVVFLNKDTGYTCGVSNYPTNTSIQKTTNGGQNWLNVNPPDVTATYYGMSVLNNDTIWVVDIDALTGGVFFTSNGGQNWTQQLYLVSNNPNKIYMFNRNIGFISTTGAYIYRTTNSGVNWTFMQSNEVFTDMFFVDSITGWKVIGNERDSVKKTTNCGITWFKQLLPHLNWISTMFKISGLNKDTLWGVGGTIQWVPSTNNFRGVVYKTINGGLNWGYQIPDTGANYAALMHIKFTNKQNGWAYLSLTNPYAGFNGFHTVTGGDTTTYSGIKKVSNNEPLNFVLYQNYPNPFNPVTNINYKISKTSNVLLEVFDINGRRLKQLVKQKQGPGEYTVKFDGSPVSSGVYFYRLQVTNEKGGIDYVETKKAILIK